jgi:hypothetical protein
MWPLGWLRGAPFLGILTALACGGTPGAGGTATVVGTVGGMEVPATDAIAIVGPLVDTFGGFTQPGVAVVISNKSDLCSVVESNANPPNSAELILIVGTPGAVAPGTYPTLTTAPPSETTNNALVTYEVADAACHVKMPHGSRSGTVVLSTVSSTTVAGSFDVTLDSGDKLSGTFRAPVCGMSIQTDASAPAKCGL